VIETSPYSEAFCVTVKLKAGHSDFKFLQTSSHANVGIVLRNRSRLFPSTSLLSFFVILQSTLHSNSRLKESTPNNFIPSRNVVKVQEYSTLFTYLCFI
jgi:hypothetical protein